MTSPFEPYASAILALGLFGFLVFLQLIVADVVAILQRHTPGTPVLADHESFLFRATRAHANSTESIGVVILIAGFAILRTANPSTISLALWVFLAARVAHMLAYYLDLRLLRSVAFAVSMVSLGVIFGAGSMAGH